MYTFHSLGIPYAQEDFTLNFCWRSTNSGFQLRKFCHVYIARVPALYDKADAKKPSVSFESVCLPGYFIRQKNYHFFLKKRDGTELFGKICMVDA